MPCHRLLHTYERSDQKQTKKKQFKILEKGKYVTPNQILEAFVEIGDDLTMNDDEYLQLIEHTKM